ncbi:MAG: DUF6265 family protein [Candidatus Eremiobacterota bacterium]
MILLLLLMALALPGAADSWKVADLAWLSGAWSGDGMQEVWSEPEAGSMLGTCRGVQDGRTVHLEFMLLRDTPEGILLQLHLPERQVTMPFRLVTLEPDLAVFERTDKPETLTYRRTPEGDLEITLDKRPGGFQLLLKRTR